MKLCIDNRKIGEEHEKAFTLYNNKGNVLTYDCKRITDAGTQKFDKILQAMQWGIARFRTIARNGEVSETEALRICIYSKTVYDWFEKERCPTGYVDLFCAVQMELSLMVNPVEILYGKRSQVLFKTYKSRDLKASNLLNAFKNAE